MPELIFYQKGEALFRFPVRSSSTQIGRSPECDITLGGETISRIQFILYEYEGSYLLKNVGKQKALIHGNPFESTPLHNEDRVSLEEWEIVFSSEESPQWNYDETYVSKAGGEGTQLINSSLDQGILHSDRIQLKISEPCKPVRMYPIQQEVTTLGKAPSCDVALTDSFASDVHCKILVRGNRILLFDLNSTNGSLINGVRVREADLEEGQEIQIGKTKIGIELVAEDRKIEPIEADAFGPIIGQSIPMREMYHVIQQIAPTDATVCILGETGSGKELVARSIHDVSTRSMKPWIALNCGAISRELIESELFGHEKGAFTGAHQQRKGAFEQAHGGTLFLDEVGELSLNLQPALLRVLETGRFRRVGGNQEISVDVRVICATHRDLAQKVKEGLFREDLFFRLYVFPIYLPALRELREDILLIANHFLKTMAPRGRKIQLSSEAAHYLESLEWRGNVRELKNVIQRALVLAKSDVLEISDLTSPGFSSSRSQTPASFPFSNSSNLENLQKEIILRELRSNEGNRSAAAKALGIAKSTLYEKIKKYGIEENVGR